VFLSEHSGKQMENKCDLPLREPFLFRLNIFSLFLVSISAVIQIQFGMTKSLKQYLKSNQAYWLLSLFEYGQKMFENGHRVFNIR